MAKIEMIRIVDKIFKEKGRKKRINVRLVFLFALLWVIVGFNTKMSDTDNYLMFYQYACDGLRYSGIEYGFYLFMRICAILGMDYFGFFKLYSFIALFMIFISVDSYCKRPIKCMWLFLFFPFFHIVVAVRNFMACAIVLFSMRFLWEEKKQIRGAICFIIGILVAATFHTAALFYLIYLLCYYEEKKIHSIVGIVLVTGVFFVFAGQEIVPLLNIISPKLTVYLSAGLKGTRFSTKLFLIIFYVAELYFCSVLKVYNFSKRSYRMRQIMVLNSFVMVLSFFNMNFMRLQYNVMVIFSVYVFNTLDEAKRTYVYRNSLKKLCYLYYTFYFLSGIFLLYFYSFESIVLTVLKNNSLF